MINKNCEPINTKIFSTKLIVMVLTFKEMLS